MADRQAEWRSRISAWQRSGQSRRAWCAAQGLNVHTFDFWRRRLREASPAPTCFVVRERLLGDAELFGELHLGHAALLSQRGDALPEIDIERAVFAVA